MLTIKVKGYAEAVKVMSKLSEAMQKSILKSALKKAAMPIIRSAQNHAPVRTGTLRKRIGSAYMRKLRSDPREVAVSIRMLFVRSKANGNMDDKTNPYYGLFVHEGTSRGVKANPFLTKAYEDSADSSLSIFGDCLAQSVNSFVRRNYKKISI